MGGDTPGDDTTLNLANFPGEIHELIARNLLSNEDLGHYAATNKAILGATNKLLRERQREQTKHERHMLLTYGAAGLRGIPQPLYEKSVLYDILGDESGWKVTDDAMVVAARTFSGAKIDETVGFHQLYPSIHPGANYSKHAFKKVKSWWRHMCAKNKEIALKTDLLSFILFAIEFHFSKLYNQKLEDNHEKFPRLEDKVHATIESGAYNFGIYATRNYGNGDISTIDSVIYGNDELSRAFNIDIGNNSIAFTYDSQDDDEEPQSLQMVAPDTVGNTLEFSLGFFKHVIRKVDIVSLQPPNLLGGDILFLLHAGHVKRFYRTARVSTEDGAALNSRINIDTTRVESQFILH